MSSSIAKNWLQASVPVPFTVLGRKLHPLSIGHITLMQWQGLAYGSSGKPTIQDLICATLICSMRFEDYRQFLQCDDVAKQLKRMGKNLDLRAIQQKFDLFDEYLSAGTDIPNFEIPDGAAGGMVMGAPWLQCLRVALMAKLHVPAAETWDYPYVAAVWDVCTCRESEGRLNIVEPLVTEDNSEQHAENVAAMEALNEEIRRAMGISSVPVPGSAGVPPGGSGSSECAPRDAKHCNRDGRDPRRNMGLKVKVDGDGSGFQATLDKLSEQAQNFGSTLNSKISGNFSEAIMGIVPGLSGAIAGIFSADAIKESIAHFAELGEQIHFGAIRLNVEDSDFQHIKTVLDYTKTDIGTVETAFDKLAVSLRDIERGDAAAGNLQQSLAELGVTAEDIKSKNYQEVFFQIADGLKGINPSKEQVAALRDILGKGGDNLLPAFQIGFDSDYAKSGTLDKGALDSIEAYNADVRTAQSATAGFWNRTKEGMLDFWHVARTSWNPFFWAAKIGTQEHGWADMKYAENLKRLHEIDAAKQKAAAHDDAEQKHLRKHFSDDAAKAKSIEAETAAIRERNRIAAETPEQRRKELLEEIRKIQGELDYGDGNTAAQEAAMRKKIEESKGEIAKIDREQKDKKHPVHAALERLGNANIGGIMLSHGGDKAADQRKEMIKHLHAIDKKLKPATPNRPNNDYH